MESSIKILVIFVFTCCLFGCKPSEKQKLTDYLEVLGKHIDSFKFVAIINADACASCSDSVKDFLSINSDNKDLLVILSSLSSKKAGFMFEGYSGSPTIVVDSQQLALKKYHLIELKPIVYNNSNEFLFKEITLFDLRNLWMEGYFIH